MTTTSETPALGPGLWWALVLANAVPVLASLVFAVVALDSPSTLLPGVHEDDVGARYFAAYYAARSLPIGVGLAVALVRARSRPSAVGALMAVLAIAAVAQAGDAVAGAVHGTTASVGGGAAAVIHVVSLVLVHRWSRRDGAGQGRGRPSATLSASSSSAAHEGDPVAAVQTNSRRSGSAGRLSVSYSTARSPTTG